MRITEAHVRSATSFALWSVSGGILLALFWTLAGTDPIARVLAIGWALSLLVGMVLTWRLPDRRRWLALVLELVVIASGVAMARTRIQAADTAASQARLERVHASAEYRADKVALDQAQGLQNTLLARLAALPPEFVTAAANLTKELQAAGERERQLVAELADLETGATRADGESSMFALFGAENTTLVETLLALILALGTEGLALVLSGRAGTVPRVPQTGRDVHARADNVPQTPPASVPDAPKGVTADEYLAAARALGTAKRLAGYRTVMEHLGIGEREARRLIKELVTTGKLKMTRRTLAKPTE